jgi:phenylalanyl-tRNA synthetase beta chain
MKVSLNTVKQYVDIDLTIDELVKKVNEQLGGVEEVIDLSAKYRDAIIVRVVDCDKHPDADRLSVCWVDDAGIVADVERDERGYVQVVCGAPNVHADMFAIWLPPRATVPSTYGTDEPFVLDARELRGVKSNGMLAAADELAIGSDHSGIIELDAAGWNPNGVIIQAGARFAEAYGLDDIIIDIENKMFTHRPDCFGQIGVAREIAGITGKRFKEPHWLEALPEFASGEGLELAVINEAEGAVPRLMSVAVKNVTIEQSPLWLQCELIRLGSKPISNIVDITNYVMLLTGQPTHAYDYDKVGGTILARYAKDGETIKLLNGKEYSLTSSDIVITDGENPIGLGGVMGGADSEVSDSTTNIILECANFDMYTVRKTSMRHGLFTDAVTRYNKGQSSLQQPYIIDLALKSIQDTTGGTQASEVFDVSGELSLPQPIDITVEFINARLGSKLTSADIIELLENVSISVTLPSENNSYLQVEVPFWRTDLELPEDIVEEVGRLSGFESLPRELPKRPTIPAERNHTRVLKQAIRQSLSRAGANEVLTYSFVHEKTLMRAGQNVQHAFRLSNALSPDLQYYRLSVLPSLLDKVHMNAKAGYDEFALYEIGKTHTKADWNGEDLPAEYEYIDGVYAARSTKEGAAYYRARRLVEQLCTDLDIQVIFMPFEAEASDVVAPFEPSRTAAIMTLQGETLGVVGEFKQAVQKAFKLPDYVAGFSLELAAVMRAYEQRTGVSSYTPLSRYPRVAEDISLKSAASVRYTELLGAVEEGVAISGNELQVAITLRDLYQGEQTDTKTTTFHVEFTSFEKTLQVVDIRPIMESIGRVAAERLGAEVV